jgi:hypothetical protein
MAEQVQVNEGAAGYGVRPDPLQLALEAISDAERVQPAVGLGLSSAEGGRYAVLAQRAQLRVLYAIAEELRLLRLEQRGAADRFAQINLRLVEIGEALRSGEVADGNDE